MKAYSRENYSTPVVKFGMNVRGGEMVIVLAFWNQGKGIIIDNIRI